MYIFSFAVFSVYLKWSNLGEQTMIVCKASKFKQYILNIRLPFSGTLRFQTTNFNFEPKRHLDMKTRWLWLETVLEATSAQKTWDYWFKIFVPKALTLDKRPHNHSTLLNLYLGRSYVVFFLNICKLCSDSDDLSCFLK